MATSGELRALLVRSRGVLEQIKAKQVKVGGGSGRRERYEMRQTGLYFDLGSLLLEYFSQAGIGRGRRSTNFAPLFAATKDLELYEGDHPGAVRFGGELAGKELLSGVSKI